MRFCGMCGKQILNEKAVFCPYCGQPAGGPQEQDAMNGQPTQGTAGYGNQQAAAGYGNASGAGSYGNAQTPGGYGTAQGTAGYGNQQAENSYAGAYNAMNGQPAQNQGGFYGQQNAPANTYSAQNPQGGGYQQYGQPQHNQYNYSLQMETGMIWYKFIIYVALFVGGAVNIIYGIWLMAGGLWAGYASYIYAYIPGFRALDIIIGLLSVILGIFAIYTRFRLSAFRKDGPKCLYALYVFNAIIYAIYAIAWSAILASFAGGYGEYAGIVLVPSVITSIVISIIMIIVNYIYFSHRKHMFVN